MAWLYTSSLIITSIVCAVLYFYTKQKFPDHGDSHFRKFQICYLAVYLLALGRIWMLSLYSFSTIVVFSLCVILFVAGDWLQGPYVYALYESYGMAKQDIELLFVAGFGASMVFGPIAGSLADKLYLSLIVLSLRIELTPVCTLAFTAAAVSTACCTRSSTRCRARRSTSPTSGS